MVGEAKDNNVILECGRCLNMFMASTFKLIRIGEGTWGTKCRCGNTVEFTMDYMESIELWAQPNITNRIRKIDHYNVRVEGLTYSKDMR